MNMADLTNLTDPEDTPRLLAAAQRDDWARRRLRRLLHDQQDHDPERSEPRRSRAARRAHTARRRHDRRHSRQMLRLAQLAQVR